MPAAAEMKALEKLIDPEPAHKYSVELYSPLLPEMLANTGAMIVSKAGLLASTTSKYRPT